jgi:imidazolonepropionase-like amidohydrolase
VAFVGVKVLAMDRDRVLRNQTVLVEGGKIEAIGQSVHIPSGAVVVDGHGTAFLSPGLADRHSHSDNPEDLIVYLANGVTTF